MPSPPDVILVLSPRMARLVMTSLDDPIELPDTAEFASPADKSGLAAAGDAMDALVREIRDQLSPNRALERAVGTADDITSRQRGDSDVARVAAKMAKAARGAVEPDFGHISEDQSPEEIARQVEESDPRGPGDGLGA